MAIAALKRLKQHFAFRRDLARVLARRLRPEDCAGIVREEITRREANFLLRVERDVYGNPRSPYLPLLRDAGIGLEEIRASMGRSSLEATLGELRDAGVYLSFEEYKGRAPIVRGARTYRIDPGDFVAGRSAAMYESTTGGSTGPAVRVAQSLEQQAEQAVYTGLISNLWMPPNCKVALWRSERPNASVNALLRLSLIGQPPAAWFTPMLSAGERPSWQSRALLKSALGAMRRQGLAIPDPEYVPLDEAHRIAAWAASEKRAGITTMIQCNVSSAVRVCDAARRHGIDIAGVRFFMLSEPLTEAKRREIENAGAVPISVYSAVDAGRLAVPCLKPLSADDMHVCKDIVAIIARRRMHPATDETIDSLLITTLAPSNPLFLLNVEFDDFGRLETRDCGCPLAGLGLDQHVSRVRSFAKLTAAGTAITSARVASIIEEALPHRFGGASIDYQLLEEDLGSATRLTIVVSPRVGEVVENDVIAEFLRQVRVGHPGLREASR
ncbi:MAG TPA: hypothetical protein VGH16_11190, partial [Candidatus Binatia bacterium]